MTKKFFYDPTPGECFQTLGQMTLKRKKTFDSIFRVFNKDRQNPFSDHSLRALLGKG
jgi:hypothetical protein